MRAVVLHRFGAPEVLQVEEVPIPAGGPPVWRMWRDVGGGNGEVEDVVFVGVVDHAPVGEGAVGTAGSDDGQSSDTRRRGFRAASSARGSLRSP